MSILIFFGCLAFAFPILCVLALIPIIIGFLQGPKKPQ